MSDLIKWMEDNYDNLAERFIKEKKLGSEFDIWACEQFSEYNQDKSDRICEIHKDIKIEDTFIPCSKKQLKEFIKEEKNGK